MTFMQFRRMIAVQESNVLRHWARQGRAIPKTTPPDYFEMFIEGRTI
jgi:hypothetical protein